MAENSRGQNRNQRKNNGPSNSQDENRSNKKNTSGGLRDTNLDRVRNENRTPKSSGLSAKRNITGSDYDGQLSDE